MLFIMISLDIHYVFILLFHYETIMIYYDYLITYHISLCYFIYTVYFGRENTLGSNKFKKTIE